MESQATFQRSKKPQPRLEPLLLGDPIQILSITQPLLGARGNNMAIRYVKDFEFPSAAGYTKSSPSKVTGQMFAKGGKVEKEPKGMMVIIGVGKPKGPMKKAEGGDTTTNPNLGPGPLQMPSDEQINKENWNQRKAIRRAMGAKNTGKDTFAKGGKVAKVMGEFGEGKLHSGSKKGPKVTNPKQAIAIALNEQREAKKSHGGKIGSVPVKDIKSGKVKQSTDEDFYGKAKDMPMPPRRPSMLKKGGMPHEDVKEDTALIKKMVKPDALKKAMGGAAVQMAKSNAIADSLKGQKKTPYAEGGVAARPFGSGARQTAPSVGSTQYKADGGMALAAPRVASPLQQMGARPSGVPVAPRAPMIPQQAAPMSGGPRIGVGRSRSGKPDVGAIRAAMARAATQATPENAPSMMKKGGKVGC
jgi:hypothetical protein